LYYRRRAVVTPNPDTQRTIIQYIQQTRATYTREAITNQLLASGYPPPEIEAAWATIEGADPSGFARVAPNVDYDAVVAPRPTPVARSGVFWLTLIGFILVSYLVPGALVFVAYNAGESVGGPLMLTALIVFFGLQIAGLVAGLVWLGRNRPVAIGLLIGLLMTDVVIPFVVGCGIAGVCIYLLNSYNSGFTP
jgi:hypothetical protein